MKNILSSFFILLLTTQFCEAQLLAFAGTKNGHRYSSKYTGASNKISQLATTQEVENFVRLLDKRFSNFKVDISLMNAENKRPDLFNAAKPKSWQTGDLDDNGFSGFLVIGSVSGTPVIICIIDTGFNDYVIKKLNRRTFEECAYPSIKSVNGKSVICYFHHQHELKENSKVPNEIHLDTLTYKFGDLVELNGNVQNHKIEKIQYTTTACFGSCPVFSMAIEADRKAEFSGIKFNKRNGHLSSLINEDDFKTLTGLLNYINFSELKNNYAVNWSDDQTSTMIITYDGGKTKTITDYGLVGTFGLNRIHDLIFKLRDNQQWR